MQQATKHDIAVDVQVHFPQNIALDGTTLSVLLSNLLENAVDACKEITSGEKKITVKGTVSDGLVYLDISNNYTGTLSKAKNGNYLTTKENGKGLGLQSVAHLVKLHNGIFEVDTTENIFRVSLMLRENADAPAQPVSP
jgi:nitrogen fixation/metabolism regulation signal transduction histidine kinase